MDRLKVNIAGETNIGAGRVKNEDNYCILAPPGYASSLAMVADGIGGHRDGEIASLFCCRAMMTAFRRREKELRLAADIEKFLAEELRNISERLFVRNEFDRRELPMGCTATCAIFTATELVYCSVGDSRLYEYDCTGHTLRQISVDDVGPGGHALCRAVGIRDRLTVTPHTLPLRPDTIYLLCSDGLHHFVSSEEIVDALKESVTSRMAVGKLMRRALLRGSGDNITVIAAWCRE